MVYLIIGYLNNTSGIFLLLLNNLCALFLKIVGKFLKIKKNNLSKKTTPPLVDQSPTNYRVTDPTLAPMIIVCYF